MMAKTIDVSELYPGYNGYVTCKGNRYYVTIPENLDASTASVCGFGYGGGGRSDNDNAIEYQKNHAEEVNTIGIYPNHESGTTVDGFMNTSGGRNAYVGLAKEIIKHFDLNENAFVSTGSSSSARAAVLREYEYLMHNEDVTGGYVIMVEPADDKSWSDQLEHNSIDDNLTLYELVNTLNEREVTTVVFRANGMESDVQDSIKMGLEVLDIHVVYRRKNDNKEANLGWIGQHGITCALFRDAGVGNIYSGTFDFNNLPTEYGSYNVTYEIGYYSNGIYHPLSFEQANEFIGNLTAYNLPKEDIIQSDNEFLSQGLTAINSIVKSSNLSDLSLEGCASTTSVPSKESMIIYKMIASSMQLFEKIGQEIVTIGAIGDNFVDMDNILADEASKIGMEVKSSLLPNVELNSYDNIDGGSVIPKKLLNELEILKNQIDNNSEDNPLIENDIVVNNEKDSVLTKSTDSFVLTGTKTSSVPLTSNKYNLSSTLDSSSTEETQESSSNSETSVILSKQTDEILVSSKVAANVSATNETIVKNNSSKSDDSYREIIKQEWGEELFPKPSNKKEKTPIIPNGEPDVIVKNYSDKTITPVEPVEPTNPTLPEKPIISVEPIEPVEPKPIDPIVPDDPIDVPTDNSELFRTIGIAAGLGTGIGTIAYGINNQIGKRELRDGYDYSYEKEVSSNDYYEQESLDEQYSPYIKNDIKIDTETYKARKNDEEEGDK